MATVKKIFNNNALLAYSEEGELVLTGRGIAFGLQAGAEIEPAQAEKVFRRSAGGVSAHLLDLLRVIPAEFFALGQDIVQLVQSALQRPVSDSLFVGLTEHVFYAVERQHAGQPLQNMLLADIRHVYPREFRLAEQILVLVEERCGVALDAHEAGFIALHIVNACGTREDLADVLAATALVQEIRTLVQETFPQLDDTSLNYSRFMTHLLYFVLRLRGGRQEMFEDAALFAQVAKSYPQVVACVQTIEDLVISKGYRNLQQIEQIYLALHIQRALSSPA